MGQMRQDAAQQAETGEYVNNVNYYNRGGSDNEYRDHHVDHYEGDEFEDDVNDSVAGSW